MGVTGRHRGPQGGRGPALPGMPAWGPWGLRRRHSSFSTCSASHGDRLPSPGTCGPPGAARLWTRAGRPARDLVDTQTVSSGERHARGIKHKSNRVVSGLRRSGTTGCQLWSQSAELGNEHVREKSLFLRPRASRRAVIPRGSVREGCRRLGPRPSAGMCLSPSGWPAFISVIS